MKRYIRFKSGRVIDTERYEIDNHLVKIIKFYDKRKVKNLFVLVKDIVAESDNVKDLFGVADLYRDRENIIDEILDKHDLARAKQEAKMLWTFQKGNYILVWDSERGVI